MSAKERPQGALRASAFERCRRKKAQDSGGSTVSYWRCPGVVVKKKKKEIPAGTEHPGAPPTSVLSVTCVMFDAPSPDFFWKPSKLSRG